MSRIIAFSLYGTDRMYYVGMLRNCELAPKIYPEWKVWVYVSSEVGPDWIKQIKDRGGKVIKGEEELKGYPVGKNIGHLGAFWRFLPARDPDTEVLISRDADSRLNVRERAAVDVWLASGMKFHSMRDHYNHHYHYFMAGMWGVKGHLDVLELLKGYPLDGHKGEDQEWQKARLWPIAKNSCMEHGINGQPFPPHDSYPGFVGQRFTEHEKGLPD